MEGGRVLYLRQETSGEQLVCLVEDEEADRGSPQGTQFDQLRHSSYGGLG
jgi:hypothetical protein